MQVWSGHGFCAGRRGEFRVVVAGTEREAACALKVTQNQFRLGFRRVTGAANLRVFEGMEPGQVWIAPRGTTSYEEVDPEDLEV